MTTNILGYDIYNKSKSDLLKEIDKYEKVNIISGNPEILMNGLTDDRISKVFHSKDAIIIPDGIGVVIASKIVKQPVTEKVPGIEVMDEIVSNCAIEGKGIFLVGTKQDILEECIEKLKEKHKNLNVLGSHNGFFDIDNCRDIIDEIKEKKPYALFVAMGSPRQELFLEKYMDELPCKVFMGVGGSFDVFAGRITRAPKWMIKLGLEWLHRVIKEPVRIKRLNAIPKFLLKVQKSKYIIKE